MEDGAVKGRRHCQIFVVSEVMTEMVAVMVATAIAMTTVAVKVVMVVSVTFEELEGWCWQKQEPWA